MKPSAYMLKRLALTFGLSLAMASAASAQEAVGKWTGTVKTPGGAIPIIVTITKGEDGALSGGLESPSQAPGMIIPIDTIKADEELFSFTIEAIDGDFMGVWQDGAKTWSGAWTQAGHSLPLELSPAK